MKVRHRTEASGGGRSAPATPITLGFKPEEEEEEEDSWVPSKRPPSLLIFVTKIHPWYSYPIYTGY